MTELQHLAWPYQRGATVIQDTNEELRAAAAVIACTPRGWRDEDPNFGVTTPLFSQRPIDTTRLAAELTQTDPRLQVTAMEILDLAQPTVSQIGVQVG